MTKYNALLNTHFFVPLALETLGPINITGQNFISDLGRSLSLSTGDKRETCFLLQRLSITVLSRAGVGKLRPAGQIRPANTFYPARQQILSSPHNSSESSFPPEK